MGLSWLGGLKRFCDVRCARVTAWLFKPKVHIVPHAKAASDQDGARSESCTAPYHAGDDAWFDGFYDKYDSDEDDPVEARALNNFLPEGSTIIVEAWC